ncbi:MAG: DNA-directed RNA polymerase subunit beta' [Planctomycetaceae bacterium]|jgi:DNA-directed RNA polymerase subunit beta'|nr:DNA-directed RNA polymerase subunit beta' [Planctomycetaceae bacterium]
MSSEFTYDRINDYAAVKISLAKPNDIRSWSYGEVKKPETINYRTFRPERDGLFCEKIFGPEKDWECNCGKYRGMKYKGMTCDRCGVKITHSKVRRKRMGHIDLAAPVVHIWFFKAASSRLATLLSMKASSLEKVIYFQDYVVIDPGNTGHKVYELLTEDEYRKAKENDTSGKFRADMGAEAIRQLLQQIDLVSLSDELRTELNETKSKQRKKDIINRLKLVESLRDSDNKPEWMVLDVIPVIPPDLRPLVHLESGTFATSDLNDLYRRIINRNTRLKKLVDLNAPEVIIRNEKRMLQQSVDALFDNGRTKRPVLGSSNRPLKSLTDMIKGKQGRFRENLLGKRVDYSARSVIVVGPHLRLHQCGLPKKIALELFQPFIIRRLKELGHADTIKSAKKMLERKDEEVWDILEEVIQNHPVLLNRAPTLHRMGIQAFEPILVEGNAIKLHPLVCRGFNADFDGDQMAVHLPLSLEAQVEAHTLMLSTNNIFSPANGSPIISPSQDVVMGCYYVTLDRPGQLREGMAFASVEELLMAYSYKKVGLHAKIKVRMPERRFLKNDPKIHGKGVKYEDGKVFYDPKSEDAALFETTVGRVIFNNQLFKDLLDRDSNRNRIMPFYNQTLKSGDLQMVINDCFEYLKRRSTIDLLDLLMRHGFEQSTLSGLSFATDDLITPKAKLKIIEDSEKEVAKVYSRYENGLITEGERYNNVIDIWTRSREEITQKMMEELEHDNRNDWYVNPIYLMAISGARGGTEQIRQLAGMRGLMAKPNGKIIESPIKANFREGLTVLEYFSSTHGARKGLADTALKTADAGYMTRKLADVAQNVVITKDDCGTTQGIAKGVIYRGEKVEVSLADSIKGRVSRTNIVNPITDEVIVRENELITVDIARKIEELGLEKIQIRSPMTCESELGICAKCYGMDLSTNQLVEEGLAVGIIAAESIGEPGTQLTMRTFHIGGTAAHAIEEHEIKAKHAGKVKFVLVEAIDTTDGRISLSRNGQVAVLDPKGREWENSNIPIGATLHVKEDEEIKQGQLICSWDPHSEPILAKVDGIVHFEDIDEDTIRTEKDSTTGALRHTVQELKGDRQPQIILKTKDGKDTVDYYYLRSKSIIQVKDGEQVKRGTILAKTPREVAKTQDITGGLPRVTEIFEARKPKDPAVIAEIDGVVELGPKRHGKRTIIIKNEDTSAERIHDISHGKHPRVHAGDYVKAGDAITDGPLVPHDILRISGEEAVQEYLVREVQNVYRAQRVKINDKHIEIIISQMLRKVRIESSGDTKLLEGIVVDKFQFIAANKEIASCVKVVEPGDTQLEAGTIIQKDVFDTINDEVIAESKTPATCKKTELAQASKQLLGITKAAVQSSSFISAASFQETTKVLTEAALASKTDGLVGLKENVILGHLVPAGTGFRNYQNAEWDMRDDARQELAKMSTPVSKASYTLLDDIPAAEPVAEETPADDIFSVPDVGYADTSFADSFDGGIPQNDYDDTDPFESDDE